MQFGKKSYHNFFVTEAAFSLFTYAFEISYSGNFGKFKERALYWSPLSVNRHHKNQSKIPRILLQF